MARKMTDKIKVLPTITKKQMGTSADVIKLLDEFKEQIKDEKMRFIVR